MPQDLHDHFINPTHKNHQKAGKTNGKYVILYSRTNVIMIIIYVWFIIHTRLTHSPCRTSHAPSCTTATGEKNRAPTTEKTQKVSQTRSLRFSNPVLLHFKIPGPCFFCNGTGILQSGTGKLHERTESNGSFVKGHLTGRKLTTAQCRYYVDQEVKWTPCHKTYTTILSIPRIRITRKLEKQMENMSFYIRKQIQVLYYDYNWISLYIQFIYFWLFDPGTVLAAAIHVLLSFPHLRRGKQMRIKKRKKRIRQVVLAHHWIHRCMSSHIRLQSHNSWRVFNTHSTHTWNKDDLTTAPNQFRWDHFTSGCRTQFENECVTGFYDTFDVASLLLQRLFEKGKKQTSSAIHQPSIKITVLHEPRSAHGCHAMQRQGECGSLQLPFRPGCPGPWCNFPTSSDTQTRRGLHPKHAASLCTWVLKLGYICSFASSACAIGQNSKRFFTLTTWHKWLNDRKKYPKKK